MEEYEPTKSLNKTLSNIATVLVSVASIMFFYWLLSSPVQREFAFGDIQERKAIIKQGHDFKTIKLLKIERVWYVMDRDSSLEGKFKEEFPNARIIQLESPETGIFSPVQE
jgi:hypothetical protein